MRFWDMESNRNRAVFPLKLFYRLFSKKKKKQIFRESIRTTHHNPKENKNKKDKMTGHKVAKRS